MRLSSPGYRGAPAATQSARERDRLRRTSPMLGFMASQWKTLQRRLQGAENLVFNEAPKLIRQLQNPETLQRGISAGHPDRAGRRSAGGAASPRPAITAGRPVTKDSVPTAHRARRIVYAPDLDGRADPGEVVWTWVVYEDDPSTRQGPAGAGRRPRPQHAARADAVQPGTPRRRPELGRHRHRRLGLRGPRRAGCGWTACSTCPRRASGARARSWSARRSSSRRAAAGRVLLELTANSAKSGYPHAFCGKTVSVT